MRGEKGTEIEPDRDKDGTKDSPQQLHTVEHAASLFFFLSLWAVRWFEQGENELTVS